MGFSQKHVNLIASPKGSSVNVRKEATTASAILFNRSGSASAGKVASAGRTTGDFVKIGNYTWYKISLSKAYKGQSWGWVRNDVIKLYKPKADNISKAKAKSLVDNLIKSDIKVYEQALKIAPLLSAAEKNGENVSKYKNTYKGIIERLESRQSKLKTSKLLKVKTGIKKGMEFLKKGFKAYLATQFHIRVTGDSIGSITAVVIGAVIGGGVAVAAYFYFRPDYDESKTDLKMSAELEKALSLLSPEEAAALQANLEKQVDNAFNYGKSNERFGNIFSILKWVVIIGGVAFVVNKGLGMANSAKKLKSND